MCQSNAYLLDGGREELVLEDVALMEVGENQVKMRTLFGEPLSLRARVKEIDLIKNRIVLERCEEVT
jgi:predicted RNA-binding protein